MKELIVREESHSVNIVEVTGIAQFALPGSPLGLWERGELHDYLHLPHDGTKVEIIDGKIVVTHAPVFMHSYILQDISNLMAFALRDSPDYPWRCYQNQGVLLAALDCAYIPDLMVTEAAAFEALRETNARRPSADELELVVEVTSRSNAAQDRPKSATDESTKFSGYARAEIPYYLLIDGDPEGAQTTLYSIPAPATGAYLHQETWKFGATIQLPDPFNLAIPTDHWKPWRARN